MATIRILPDKVANQIAAGEVVERPAAVIKELIENSVDAGANKIEIEFRNGGKSYLRVEDDGVGMSHDEALLCLERHATSKIRKASDLNEIQTFGFRGEALPSISSVSRFTLRTRSKNNSEGNEILINGGKLLHVKDCGMPIGTRIEVSHLFNSVPVRRKFLKTEVTEASHIIHLAKLYALAHSKITFSLIENGRTLFRSPACEDLTDRVREIFGRNLAETLFPLEHTEDQLKLLGLIGKPGFSRPTRKEMIFFVNRRPVESKTISYSLMEAYHTYAPKGRFPPAVLFLQIDPYLVDVNVHPAKRELRFRDEAKVRKFLIQSVLKSIKQFNGEPVMQDSHIEVEKDQSSGQLVPKIDDDILAQLEMKSSQKASISNINSPEINFSQKNDSEKTDINSSKSHQNVQIVGLRDDLNASWHLIDFTHGNMAIFRTDQGIVGFHCLAAFERIKYEQLEDSFTKKNTVEKQKLLFSESLELSGEESRILQEILPKLSKIGFVIEEFGRNFYRLLECPLWISPELAKSYLLDFLEIANFSGGVGEIETFAKKAMINNSTKNSGQKNKFSENEIIDLANQLFRCRNPYTCPKGKPTFFEFPIRDFESRFRRNL